MDGTEIDDQIKKAELYEAVKQTLMRLLDDPQVSAENLGNLAATDWIETLADLKQLSGGSIFDYWCSRRASQVSSRYRPDLR